jgi:hypothetical protein
MSKWHSEKQHSGIDLTGMGMQFDISDEHSEHACHPISLSLEPDSNVTRDTDEQSQKQLSPRISTPAGMQIDFSAWHWENMPFSILEI